MRRFVFVVEHGAEATEYIKHEIEDGAGQDWLDRDPNLPSDGTM